jgi:hypothetical protein
MDFITFRRVSDRATAADPNIAFADNVVAFGVETLTPALNADTIRLLAVVGDADAANEPGELGFVLSEGTDGLSTLGADNTAADPVLVTAHGRINNDAVGALVGVNRVWFGDSRGFGVDNGPESGGRNLNSGDSVTFTLTGGFAIDTVSFVVNAVDGGGGATASADVALDVDGDVVDTGAYKADATAANVDAPLVLAGLADETLVEIDFDVQVLKVGGAVRTGAAVDAFFAKHAASFLDAVTIGGTTGNGFAARDLVIGRTTIASPASDAVISFERNASGANRGFDATLDLAKNGSTDFREELSAGWGAWNSSLFSAANDLDGDGKSTTLSGTGAPLDILNVVTLGQTRAASPTGHVVGQLKFDKGLVIDSAAPAAKLDDGTSLGGNYGDEGATSGANDFNGGEVIRFGLGEGFDGTRALLDFHYVLGSHEGFDVKVRLLSDGAVIENVLIDLDDGAGLVDRAARDPFGQTFDTIEVQALARRVGTGANPDLALADLDVHVAVNRPVTPLTVDFDDLAVGGGKEAKIADGYKGFGWTQTGVFETGNFGLNYKASSGPNVGFIGEANGGEIGGYDDPGETAGAPVRITRATDFDFLSGVFTPQGRAGMTVTVEGYDDGALVASRTVALGSIDPDSTTAATFSGFTSIDELRFNANDGNGGTNDYFGFDDLVFLV